MDSHWGSLLNVLLGSFTGVAIAIGIPTGFLMGVFDFPEKNAFLISSVVFFMVPFVLGLFAFRGEFGLLDGLVRINSLAMENTTWPRQEKYGKAVALSTISCYIILMLVLSWPFFGTEKTSEYWMEYLNRVAPLP